MTSPARISGHVVRFEYAGNEYTFFVKNSADTIQRYHYAGSFYEIEDLKLIKAVVGMGKCCLDVGANVGNHAIFFAKEMNARSVVCFEPNCIALEILKINVALNRAAAINLDLAAFALGADRARGAIETRHENNLGFGVLKVSGEGGVDVATGDELLTSERFSFAKIDVEGHEMAVLRGLEHTIARDRPTIYVEVNNANAKIFKAWTETHDYVVKEQIKRYEVNANYLIIPAESC